MSVHRVRIDMPMFDIVKALSEGNIGALNVCMALFKDCDTGAFDLIWLDSLRIYGRRIWMLFKDVCRQDLGCVRAVLMDVRKGDISRETLNAAIDNYGAGIDVAPYLAEAARWLFIAFALAASACNTPQQDSDCLRTCEAIALDCHVNSEFIGDGDLCRCCCHIKMPPHRLASPAKADGSPQ